jgi:hypothetical protein
MKRAGLKNPAVAEAAGVHPTTVSRWRSDTQLPEEAQLDAVVALLAARGVAVTAAWLRYGDQSPANGGRVQATGYPPTVHVTKDLPRQLRLMALDFEREALEAGADEPFMRYVRSSFGDPDFVALFGDGPDERPMTAEEAVDEMKAHVAELRAILERRLKRLSRTVPDSVPLEDDD